MKTALKVRKVWSQRLYEHFMDFLFETYGLLYPMIWVSNSRRFKRAEPGGNRERGSIRCRSRKYPQNSWQNSYTTIIKRWGRILAANQPLKHGSRYRNRRRGVWWPPRVWHCWNWPQQPERGKTQGAILQSRVKPNGVAEMGNATRRGKLRGISLRPLPLSRTAAPAV
jgi:hypothetical protein